MALLLWNKILSVNVESIDIQHKRIIDILNNFHESIQNGAGKENTERVLRELQEYAIYHFSYEEKLLADNQYQELKAHIDEHDMFVDSILKFEDRLVNGEESLNLEIATFIRDWIYNHIMINDMKYSSFLENKGVK